LIPGLATIVVVRAHVRGAPGQNNSIDIIQQGIQICAAAQRRQQQRQGTANIPYGDDKAIAGAVAGMVIVITEITNNDDNSRCASGAVASRVAVGGAGSVILHSLSLSRQRAVGKVAHRFGHDFGHK